MTANPTCLSKFTKKSIILFSEIYHYKRCFEELYLFFKSFSFPIYIYPYSIDNIKPKTDLGDCIFYHNFIFNIFNNKNILKN